jgi:NAD(P)-dependent dehydrogenase (short-subunit alcohol dehydrogenase family)
MVLVRLKVGVEVRIMKIEGSAVLVTGAGRGLGEALARELARRGARLVLTARHLDDIERVAREIVADGGVAHALPNDVSDKNSTYALAGAAAALVGPIDVLVHNASTLGPTPLRPLGDTDCEDLEVVLATNLVGPFRLTKATVGSMVVRRRGAIVQISSDAAVNAYPTWGAYSVSKAALDHLGRIWAAELADSGVSFVNVDPGEMDTRMHADAVPEADRSTLRDPARVARHIADLIAAIEERPSGSRVEVAA